MNAMGLVYAIGNNDERLYYAFLIPTSTSMYKYKLQRAPLWALLYFNEKPSDASTHFNLHALGTAVTTNTSRTIKSFTMSSGATFSQSPGPLGELFRTIGVSHAAKIPLTGQLVVTAGQPGFDLKTGQLVTSSIAEEAGACFDCVEAALQSAGVKGGLSAAHKFTAFLVDLKHDEDLMEVWRARHPNHRPAWVTVGVKELAVPGMHFEIQAEAIIAG